MRLLAPLTSRLAKIASFGERQPLAEPAHRYHLLEEIGRGGRATIYLAYDLAGGLVAIKIPHARHSMRSFLREIRIMRQLQHPNIIRIVSHGPDSDRISGLDIPLYSPPFLALEYAGNQGLDDRIAEGPISWAKTSAIALQLCSALAAMHAQHIIHRDVKPGNIMLPRRHGETRVKLTDFGLALDLQDRSQADEEFESILGTPYSMAPEQILGRSIDFRTDVYGLGVVLFQMLTGKVPFDGGTAEDVTTKHVLQSLPSPHLVNPDICITDAQEAVVRRALEKKPDQRFQSMEEFAAAIHEASGH